MHLWPESPTLMDNFPYIQLPNEVNSCPTACFQEKDTGSPTMFDQLYEFTEGHGSKTANERLTTRA